VTPPFETLHLGPMSWAAAWDIQTAAHAAVVAGGTGRLLLVEHPPTITLGRSTRPEDLPVPEGDLRARGLEVVRVSRGGSVTYHGPGQLVGYPIVSLRRLSMGPHQYVEALEEALIDALAEFRVEGYVRSGMTGVWTDHGKVAAIGIQVKAGATLHGFCLNVSPDLAVYEQFVPCGLWGERVTSLHALGVTASVREVEEPVAAHLVRVLADAARA